MRTGTWAKVAAAGLVLAAGASASAQEFFYGSDGFTSALVRIRVADGTSQVVGTMPGLGNGVGMAFNPRNGLMYVRDFDTLFTVDVNTAQTQQIGPSGSFITALAFSTDYTTLYSFDQGNGDFYHVNPGTGQATRIGNTGIPTPLDMSMSPGGVLYAATISGSIYTINPNNGQSNLVWNNVGVSGLTSIQFDQAGNLYGVTISEDNFIRIDLNNGTSQVVGGPLAVQDVRGMAWIPAPGAGAIAGLGLLAAARRRR